MANILNDIRTQSPAIRKLAGLILLGIGCLMAFLGGFKFYTPIVEIVNNIFVIAGLLLGIGNITDIWKYQKTITPTPTTEDKPKKDEQATINFE